MPDRASPSVHRRRLAAELRRLRERAGLTGEEVADQLGWSNSKVSRIELHRIGVKQADLRRLLDLYEIEDAHRDDLLALAKESTKKSWLETITARFPEHFAAYVAVEAEAQSVWNWEPQVVPGLLQTPDYARAVMAGFRAMFEIPAGEVERRVEARLARQLNLSRVPLLELSVIIDESVLRRRFGTRSVMREQLEKLIITSGQPNIDLRIFPLDSDPPLVTGAFSYMRFPKVHHVSLPDLVSVEHLEATHYIDDEEHTNMYRIMFGYVRGLSLDPARSRERIADAIHQTWT